MKNPPFHSLVWGSLRLAPTTVSYVKIHVTMQTILVRCPKFRRIAHIHPHTHTHTHTHCNIEESCNKHNTIGYCH